MTREELIKEIEEEIKRKIRILDILRRILGIQTQLEKLQTELMVRNVCKDEGLSDKEADLIVAVIKCESGMNPRAINKNPDGTYDYGLCQFNSYWYIEKMKLITKEEALYNPEKAVRLMIKRYREGFLNDWVCYKTKKYLAYLS